MGKKKKRRRSNKSKDNVKPLKKVKVTTPNVPTNYIAIIAFVLAILAVFLFWMPFVGIVISLIVVILGIIGSLKNKPLRGLAYSALIIGVVLLFLSTIVTCYLISAYRTGLYDYEVAPEIECNNPYMLHGSRCCLDMDNSAVCDDYEGLSIANFIEIEVVEEPSVVEEVVADEQEEEVVIEEPIEEEEVLADEPEEEIVEEETEEVTTLTSYLTLEDVFEEQINVYKAAFDNEEDFEYSYLAIQPAVQTASIGDYAVYVLRVKNKYVGREHYFKISLRSNSLQWIQNADETSKDVYTMGPITITDDKYFDIPVILKIGPTYGDYDEDNTYVSGTHSFSAKILESSIETSGYDIEKSAKSFSLVIE